MFRTHAVRYVMAWLTILLALGLIDYAHLHSGSSHPRSASPAHVSLGLPPATSGRATSAPSASGTPTSGSTTTRTSSITAPKPTPRQPVAITPVSRNPAPPTAPAVDPQPIHPAAAPAPRAAEEIPYVVQPGDTLWGLAAEHLGSGFSWPELFNLNRGRLEPGGRALTDPNLIVTGWTIEFPATATGLTAHSTAGTPSASTPAAWSALQSPANGARAPTGGFR